MTDRIREHLGAPETRAFVGAAVEVCCGWTTRQSGDRTSLEDLMARSDWAMLESREGRRQPPVVSSAVAGHFRPRPSRAWARFRLLHPF